MRLKHIHKLSVLKALNTTLESSLLDLIMEPSGSWKTSLLNPIARRLHDSVATKYETRGDIQYFHDLLLLAR